MLRLQKAFLPIKTKIKLLPCKPSLVAMLLLSVVHAANAQVPLDPSPELRRQQERQEFERSRQQQCRSGALLVSLLVPW